MNEDILKSESLPAVEEIVFLLGKEIAFSDEFLVLLEEERQAIIKMDVATLVTISRRKMLQLDQLQDLDKSVEKRAESLLKGRTVSRRRPQEKRSGKIVHLSAIAEISPQEHRKVLLQSKEQLAARRRAIDDKNFINKRLVEDSLGYLNDAISLFTPVSNEPAYGKRSGGRKNKFQPALISRAV